MLAAFDVADIYGNAWTHGAGTSGRDEGREGICLLRELRDGFSLPTVHKAGQRGSPSLVGENGQIYFAHGKPRVVGSCSVEKETTNIGLVV